MGLLSPYQYIPNMSIATLKRKTAAKYNNMSVGLDAFSLNGAYRNQGFVGQTSLSRSLPHTPMKGPVARGHGGCCGKYRNGPIIQSAVTSLNNNTVVKPTVLTNSGLISTKYRWVRRPDPFATYKEGYNIHTISDANDVTKQVKQQTLYCNVNSKKPMRSGMYKGCDGLPANAHTRNSIQNRTCDVNVVKPPGYIGALDQGVYILGINAKCWTNDILQRTNELKQVSFISNSLA